MRKQCKYWLKRDSRKASGYTKLTSPMSSSRTKARVGWRKTGITWVMNHSEANIYRRLSLTFQRISHNRRSKRMTTSQNWRRADSVCNKLGASSSKTLIRRKQNEIGSSRTSSHRKGRWNSLLDSQIWKFKTQYNNYKIANSQSELQMLWS